MCVDNALVFVRFKWISDCVTLFMCFSVTQTHLATEIIILFYGVL